MTGGSLRGGNVWFVEGECPRGVFSIVGGDAGGKLELLEY